MCYEYNPSPPEEREFGRPTSYSSVVGAGGGSRGGGGASPAQTPTIISRGETIRAAIGERVVLPCQVKNLGEEQERLFAEYFNIMNLKSYLSYTAIED